MSEIPVHCVIEALAEGCCLKCDSSPDKARLADSYAFVPRGTPLSKLNDTVLTALGFPQFVSSPIKSEPAKTKGLIVIENWKPLAFESITDDLDTPIEHLFKHIGGNRWTLNILVAAPVAKTARAYDAIIENTSVIRKPEDVARVHEPRSPRVSSDPTDGINWLQMFPRYHPYLPGFNAYTPKAETISPPGLAALMANRLLLTNAELTAAAALVGHPSPLQLSSKTATWPEQEETEIKDEHPPSRTQSEKSRSPKYASVIPQRRSVLVAPRSSAGTSGSSGRQGAPASCRLMFDPLTELPMLNEWFEHNSHPTCHDIEKYTELLNSKPYRRTYPPVSTHNVKIWFKNRRAKCKRM